MLWDNKSFHAEGLNEYGVSVISTNNDANLYLRKCLFEQSAELAHQKIVEFKVEGITLVADQSTCYCVRIQNGELISQEKCENYNLDIGYDGNTDKLGTTRSALVSNQIQTVVTPDDLLNLMSQAESDVADENALKVDYKRNSERTVAQLMLIPSERTLHFRPIWCEMKFNFARLNYRKEQKTSFEVISARKLLSFKDLQK